MKLIRRKKYRTWLTDEIVKVAGFKIMRDFDKLDAIVRRTRQGIQDGTLFMMMDIAQGRNMDKYMPICVRILSKYGLKNRTNPYPITECNGVKNNLSFMLESYKKLPSAEPARLP